MKMPDALKGLFTRLNTRENRARAYLIILAFSALWMGVYHGDWSKATDLLLVLQWVLIGLVCLVSIAAIGVLIFLFAQWSLEKWK